MEEIIRTYSEKCKEIQTMVRQCFICKKEYQKLHSVYPTLCPECGDLNYYKRFQTANLKDQLCVVTCGRIKIGYLVALKLLRAGATVVITTRFPNDALLKYTMETDFASFSSRLKIYGMNTLCSRSVDEFVDYLKLECRDREFGIDVFIDLSNLKMQQRNIYYKHLIEGESKDLDSRIIVSRVLPKDFKSTVEVCYPNLRSKLNPLLEKGKSSGHMSHVIHSYLSESVNEDVIKCPRDKSYICESIVDIGSMDDSWHKMDMYPLNLEDGASRILDPIFTSVNSGNSSFASFYKDYKIYT